ncbi:MAG TPA: hypothetical protein VFQ39_14830, partial [Longimicrobium sp.]|nr:hypothetical protein [Longimicrobium sp.]
MSSPQPSLLVLTGASGAGKTAVVDALEAMRIPGVGCYRTDSLPVPPTEEMVWRWGGTLEWQDASTAWWIELLLRNDDGVEAAVLEGQLRPHVARLAFERLGARAARVVLVDCDADVRNERLRGPRGQPELISGQMDCWAAYLRGQAD